MLQNKSKKLTQIVRSSIAMSLLSLLTLGTSASAQQTTELKLPELGTVASSALTIDKEIRVGNMNKMLMLSKLPIIHDPLIDEYINQLGFKLVAYATDVKTPFEFFMVKNKTINAFASFGGHVGIHSGLLLLADNESELASVLSHEIIHVTQRHLARFIQKRTVNNAAAYTAALGSIALVMAGASEVGMAGLQAALALNQQLNINYTRDNEQEADRLGIELLANSGFNPSSASSFFSKMAEQYRYASKPPPMLLSHPVTQSRISEARIRAQAYNSPAVTDEFNFLQTKVRLLVRFTDKSDDDIRHYLTSHFNHPNHLSQRIYQYGKALLAYKNNDYDLSLSLVEPLHKNDTNNLYYVDLLTDIYLSSQRTHKALTLLASYDKYMNNNSVITLNYATALIQAKDYDLARSKLQRFVERYPHNPLGWSMLLDVNVKSGNELQRHIVNAENLALYGNFKGAIKALYEANNAITDDDITRAKVQARIKQLKQQEENLKKLKI